MMIKIIIEILTSVMAVAAVAYIMYKNGQLKKENISLKDEAGEAGVYLRLSKLEIEAYKRRVDDLEKMHGELLESFKECVKQLEEEK